MKARLGEYEISPGASRITIGSAADNDLVLDGLSPYHAKLICDDNEYILRPLGFLDTWLNGELVHKECALVSGDVITLGETRMLFQVEEPDEIVGS